MRAAGMKVVLGLGLQYPPAWVFSYPDSRYVDQYGNTAPVANLTFNATLRQKAGQYLARVNADLGLNNFWAVRVGAGGNIETLYPDEMGRNAYWAYDATAQAGSPYPGWRPGQTSWNGQPVTTAMVASWYDWYVRSLVSGVNWQLDAYRSLGYGGFLQVLLPGQGVRPTDDAKAIADYLRGAGDANGTVGRGAAWERVLAAIANRTNVVAYVSSVADGSGSDDLCSPADAGVAPTSGVFIGWSAARWVSYLASRYGLARNGENPGPSDTNSYGSAMLRRAAAQMQSCGFQGLMWAHDVNLYDGQSGMGLADYGTTIAATR
jgi:hypothetical protein